MDLEVTSEIQAEYLKITAKGRWQLADIMKLIQEIKVRSERSGQNKVLVDILGIEGNPSQMDRFYVGERIAEVFGPKLKVSVVAPDDRINKFAETTAVNRGARFNVSSSEQEAINWLMSSSSVVL